MGFFSTKKIAQRKNSLGDLLKNTRLKYKLKLHHIVEYTNIRKSYIIAIEQNNWDQLPDLTYAKNFVLCYAKFLELDSDKIANRFEIEVNKQESIKTSDDSDTDNNKKKKKKLVITPRMLTTTIAVVMIFGVSLYTYFQINYLTQVPKLQINEPADYSEVFVNKIHFTGETDPENIIYINNQPLTTDKHGHFSTPVQLQNGYNIIKVTAENKIGKKTTSTKVIIANLDNNNSDTIDLVITASGSDVWIRLKTLSGETIFDGVLDENAKKTFSHLEPILLTTTNAGSTELNINEQDLGALGEEGEIIEDLQISNQPETSNI